MQHALASCVEVFSKAAEVAIASAVGTSIGIRRTRKSSGLVEDITGKRCSSGAGSERLGYKNVLMTEKPAQDCVDVVEIKVVEFSLPPSHASICFRMQLSM